MDLFNQNKWELHLSECQHYLKQHNREDLKIVAVNRMYPGHCYCVDRERKINQYIIDDRRVQNIGIVIGAGFGTNYEVIDENFIEHRTVPLKRKNEYTSCAQKNLDTYLEDGWQIDYE